MVVVAQLVRALDCGSRGRRFDSGQSPIFFLYNKKQSKITALSVTKTPSQSKSSSFTISKISSPFFFILNLSLANLSRAFLSFFSL